MRVGRVFYKLAHSELSFVPQSKPLVQEDVHRLQEFISRTERLLVLTGAGLSTESGIPDYRSDKVGLYARTDRRPVQYRDFVSSAKARQRYWARNFVGWPRFRTFQPNDSHLALCRWEKAHKLSCLVTQNVDALHSKAGSQNVVELHGCSHRVVCLDCPKTMHRDRLQIMFKECNPDWNVGSLQGQLAPDGDVLLTDQHIQNFKVPACPACEGILKPEVVFFGDNVRRAVVDEVFQAVQICDSILVAGSSLDVYSGYRFVRRAEEEGKRIAIVNIGNTRADHLAHLKIEARCGEVLPRITV